jgi:hypothetical protein
MKKFLVTGALAALLGAGGLVVFTAPAAAYVVCNRGGDCWHSDSQYRYPGVGFTIHPDDWYFHQDWHADRYHYRDYHKGRGYYKGGVWITF